MEGSEEDRRDALARRARAGERGAAGELYELLEPVARRVTRRFKGRAFRHAQTGDFVHAAWVELLRGFSSLPSDCSYEELKIWVLRRIRHRIFDATRRHRREFGESALGGELRDASGLAASDHGVTYADWSADVWRKVAAVLKPDDAQLIRRRHVEKLSFADIGAPLGISESSARQRHTRALQRLRKWLSEEADE
ncbi:MAG: sigma-70 family RNA polymerase sigma factor [Planctomycetota bacterium]